MIGKKKTGAHAVKPAETGRKPRRREKPEKDAFLAPEEELFDAPAPAEEEEFEPIPGLSSAELCEETEEESRQRRKKQRKSKGVGTRIGITVLICLLVAAVLAGLVLYAGYRVSNSTTNLPNVYVKGIFVGGMNAQQTADELIKNQWDEQAAAALKVKTLMGVEFSVDRCDSGAMMTREAAVAAAYRYGHTGNWLADLTAYASGLLHAVDVAENKTALNGDYIRAQIAPALDKLAQLTADKGHAVDEASSTLKLMKGAGQIALDTDALYEQVAAALENGQTALEYTELANEIKMPDFKAIYTELAIEPVEAYYDFDTKSIVDEVDGFTFDTAEAERVWNSAAVGETISIPVQVIVPEVTRETLEAKLFHDVLGEQLTTYGTWDTNRCNNLHIAISRIDGIVLNPGEEFSYNDVIGQRTEEAGFLPAGAYDDGEVVQEIGGGVCQISSTLYSACIFAQLEILERTNHYFKVDYLDYGMDATVSWPTPNFRFRNNRDYPIRIHAYYNDEHDTYNHQGAVAVEILGTDVDGSYVKLWRETWTIPHPEFPEIAIGYSILQHRDVYSKDGEFISSSCYDWLDEYYFHQEVYAERLEAARGNSGGVSVEAEAG